MHFKTSKWSSGKPCTGMSSTWLKTAPASSFCKKLKHTESSKTRRRSIHQAEQPIYYYMFLLAGAPLHLATKIGSQLLKNVHFAFKMMRKKPNLWKFTSTWQKGSLLLDL